MSYAQLLADFTSHADSEKAAGMRKYMRDQFDFLGIPTPLRRRLAKPHLKQLRQTATIDWDFIDSCWQCRYRELQYVALDYLAAVRDRLVPDDVERIRRLAQTKSWWDTIDAIDQIVGHIALQHPEVNATLLDWSTHEDFWLRRIAIDHQLGRKQETDAALLEQIIVNNLGQSEFFITKAIGWALRDYSKTDPTWVRGFIDKYRSRLAVLSVREGSKYL